MVRYFNVTGACNPRFHYMVDIKSRLEKIRGYIERGNYFTVNRARQYGKTTILSALSDYLHEEYIVLYLDFQMFSFEDFANEPVFVKAFVKEIISELEKDSRVSSTIFDMVKEFLHGSTLSALFSVLSNCCERIPVPVVLLIDEADSASNYDVFVSFLAQLRAYFNARAVRGKAAFQSVILAGVHDIKNLKAKIHSNSQDINYEGVMSPWNIATDFTVSMSFSKEEIAGMLSEYEKDYHTGMDIHAMAAVIYDYTSGYPFLVSQICKLLDEQVAGGEGFPDRSLAWTKNGFLEALKLLMIEKNTLFESLIDKLNTYEELKAVMDSLLFGGKAIVYNPDDAVIDIAVMFGFVKNRDGNVVVSNRIFETRLYNFFLTSREAQNREV